MTFKEQFAEYTAEFEKVLDKFCKGLKCNPEILSDSMKYSLQSGGKRIRPILMFAIGDLIGVERTKLHNFALALELIHTYSLIHDDLPEMDNDDFRRGKLSNHKVYGAGNAVLAGDGLLNTAYSILFNECFNGKEYICASKFICDCAGIKGMIAGQSADLLHENDETVNEDILDYIYENKTSKLLISSTIVPSILNEGKYYTELNAFGSYIGNLFQYTDDILDVEGSFSNLGKATGKDGKKGKYTGIHLYGLDGCKIKADLLADNLIKLLDGFDGDTDFLRELVYFIRQRIN